MSILKKYLFFDTRRQTGEINENVTFLLMCISRLSVLEALPYFQSVLFRAGR